VFFIIWDAAVKALNQSYGVDSQIQRIEFGRVVHPKRIICLGSVNYINISVHPIQDSINNSFI